MPLRRAFENPVLPSEKDQEMYRAFRQITTQMNRERARAARHYAVWLPALAASINVPLISRVSRNRFGLGRISFCFNADTTASVSAYWTFELVRYFTLDGVRTLRPIASWGTDTIAPRAYDPYSLLVDQVLQPGETLVLEITKTGAPSAISVSVTTEEMFSLEE